MAEINIKQKIQEYKQANPALKNWSDEQILSVMVENGIIKLSEDEKVSAFFDSKKTSSNNGLSLERTTETQIQTSNKSEVLVNSSDGKTYNLNQTLTNRINNVSKNVKKAEDENGFLGSMWSGFKNLTGIGDSSDKVREQQEAEKKLLSQFNSNPQNRANIFKQLTGVDYTPENIEKFIKGEIKLKSEQALDGYKEGQDMAADMGADIVSGIAAVGIYTAAVAAAPFTGGASIAIGVVAAGASAAAIKTGLKFADAKVGGREYTTDNLKKDLATGAFSGVLAPVTGGLGGAVGKTVATKLGIQAVKQVGKEVAETTVESGIKQGLKTALTNPTGYEYIGGTMVKRGLALGSEMATDGALGGAIDNAFRTAYDGGSLEDIGNSAVEGFVGGAIMSPIIGGGMKVAGKGMQKAFGKDNVYIDASGKQVEVVTDNDLINFIGKDLFNKNKDFFKDKLNRLLIYSMYKNNSNIQEFHFVEMKNTLKCNFNNKNIKKILLSLSENGSKINEIFTFIRLLENEYPTHKILNEKFEYINDDLINSLLNLKKINVNNEVLFTFTKLKLDTFNKNSYEILQNYSDRYFSMTENLAKTSSKELFNEIYTLIKDIEFNNKTINKNEIIELFSSINLENLKSNGDNKVFLEADIKLFQTYIEMFKSVPIKNNEKLSDYFYRINELRLSNEEQLLSSNAKKRFNQNKSVIESRYIKEESVLDKIELTEAEVLEFEKNKDYYILEAGNPSTRPGMGNSNYGLKDKLLAKGLQNYKRYNSTEYFIKNSDKRPYLRTNNYKYPPVIRFLSPHSGGARYKSTSDIVNSFPKIGDTYQANALKCCFTTPVGGNENLIISDVIVEIHPKSEISKAHYIEGWGNEVRYGGNTKFIVIDKYCEIKECDIGSGFRREVKGHVILQEL